MTKGAFVQSLDQPVPLMKGWDGRILVMVGTSHRGIRALRQQQHS